MGKYAQVILIILITGCGWSQDTIIREVSWQGLRLIDMRQTMSIADQPERYHEINPVIGRHPSREWVVGYFVLSGIAHIAAVHFLPNSLVIDLPLFGATEFSPKRNLQVGSFAATAALIIHNESIGLDP